ncbi:MAG: GAF domain-containing protein, partial [Candidatus Bathyarchaeota archaeon]|nr:GAF domain-containing protein [Candidatus Bathyarchaeota archaeon]
LKKLEALHQFSARIAECKTREEVAQETMTVVYDVLEHRFGAFGYIENDKIVFYEQKRSTLISLPLDGKGITVRAVRTGKSQLVYNVQKDPDYVSSREPEDNQTYSELDVPIKINDKVVAIINLESATVNRFSHEDQQLVETLAIHIASTLKNIEFEQKLEDIHSHTLILDKLDDTIEALASTYEMLKEKLGYKVLDIIKIEKGRLYNVMSIQKRYYNPRVEDPGITTRAARTGKTQLVNNIHSDPEYLAGRVTENYLSELSVPVEINNKLVYILDLKHIERDAFTDEDKYLVELIGVILGQTLSRIERLELLEETVKERTHDLTEANVRLERLSAMKTRFVSTATHEIRTPLTVMKGYLELSKDTEDMNVIHNYLDVVFRSTERLENLVNDLLDSQRIEEGRLTIKRTQFELNSLINSIIEDMKPLIESKNQSLEFVTPKDEVMVNWDEARIRQLIINLLSNASKYSEENTHIKIDMMKQKDNVLVTVTDQGYGFTEEEKKVMFTPFPDFIRPVQTATSVGLGLSICKAIVELHRGQIWAESDGMGKGSVFKFSIPVSDQ